MKRALLVGINNYKLPGADLNGCVNDVTAVASLLISKYGFAPDDIKTLLDSDATKGNIEAELLNLVLTSDENSTLVFQFSGHGTHIRDLNGDESDRRDECLCPYDVYDETTLIKDDWITDVLARIPKGARFYFLADCCHSGTLHREMPIGNPHPRKIRFLRLPTQPLVLPRNVIVRPDVVESGPYLLLTGCRDNQTSADAWFGDRYHGAMTFALLQAESAGVATWRSAHSKMLETLGLGGFDQIPQLTGPVELLDGSLFG